MNRLRLTLQILLPVVVIVGGGFVAMMILGSKQQPIIKTPDNLGPLVRALVAQPDDVRLDVQARGSVEALRTVDLAAEVGGRIIKTHAALRAGGTFTPNDFLVEIDPSDYSLMITQQKAAVARAELRLLQEQAEGAAAVRAWQQLEGDKPADPLVRREPQIRDARLALAAAKAQQQRAEQDLLRTKVQVPFSGRVRSVHADIGQTVQRGQRLAVVLDTTEFEVRLPIPLTDTAFVELPLDKSTEDGPAVKLTAEFAGQQRTWNGSIVRTEGEIDRRTRQMTAIARVRRKDGTMPLLVGMFVEARITGRAVKNVFTVPSSALHSGNRIWVIEPTDEQAYRLRDREVDVLRTERQSAVLRSGLSPGELVCLTSLQAPVDGMAVRIRQEEAATGEEK